MSGFENNNNYSARPEGGYTGDRGDNTGMNEGMHQGGRTRRGMNMDNDDFGNSGTRTQEMRDDNYGSRGRQSDGFGVFANPVDSTFSTRGGGFSDGLNGDSNANANGSRGRQPDGFGEFTNPVDSTFSIRGGGFNDGLNGDSNSAGSRAHEPNGFGEFTNPVDSTFNTRGGGFNDGLNGDSNTDMGTSGVRHGGHHGHHGDSMHASHDTKASMGDKIKGTIEETIGKITKNPTKIEHGHEMKSGHHSNSGQA